MRRTMALLRGLFLAAASAAPAFATATIVIQNNNAAGVGFNDPAPVAPVGGNTGTTLGQQRIIAFQHAADIWGQTLDSNAGIIIAATFEPLSCTSTGATLGSAGALNVFVNFANAPRSNTCNPVALASKMAGVRLQTTADIRARFNVNLGNPGCLTGIGWYLGLDNNHGSQIDLAAVLLHEFGHGLGFQQFASLTTGAFLGSPSLPLPDVYEHNLYDKPLGKTCNQMSNAERVSSALNSRRVVWTGPQVHDEMPDILAPGVPILHVDAPSAIRGYYPVGTAQFGAPLATPGIGGILVLALDTADAAGPTTFDACSPITNAAEVAGRIAVVERGTCGFVVKVKNAQDAGAIAAVVADNAAGSPPAGLGGADPAIVIPSVRVSLPDGNAIKAQLAAGVSATMGIDMTLRLGADEEEHVQINAPNPLVSGSSISHWDPIAFPNQLMEPNINGDLTHSLTGVDLTLAQMRDIGWYPDADLDMVADGADNCPAVANAGQEDNDGDAAGDVCDDDDNDGVMDASDECPLTVPDLGLDADHNGCTGTIAGLKGIVSGLTVPPKTKNGLLGKLNEAEKAVARGAACVAVNKLFDFIDQVEGIRGSYLDDPTADLLVTYARNLIRLQGGPRQPRDGGSA